MTGLRRDIHDSRLLVQTVGRGGHRPRDRGDRDRDHRAAARAVPALPHPLVDRAARLIPRRRGRRGRRPCCRCCSASRRATSCSRRCSPTSTPTATSRPCARSSPDPRIREVRTLGPPHGVSRRPKVTYSRGLPARVDGVAEAAVVELADRVGEGAGRAASTEPAAAFASACAHVAGARDDRGDARQLRDPGERRGRRRRARAPAASARELLRRLDALVVVDAREGLARRRTPRRAGCRCGGRSPRSVGVVRVAAASAARSRAARAR